jgi:DNA polymerase sigma
MLEDLTEHERLFQKVKKIILSKFPNARVLLFGSTGANLAIKGSDIDISVIDEMVSFPILFHTSHSVLVQDPGFAFVEMISLASVPIIKLKDAKTQIFADITFNRPDSFRGVNCALGMQIQFAELRPLYFVLK